MKQTSGDLAPTKTHPATTVGAVHLRVNDLDTARKFYTRMLGLTAHIAESGELVLSADGATPLLVIQEDKAAPPRDERTTGLYHFALLLPDRAELGRLVKNIASTRYQFDGLVDHTISEAAYLTDPEGNGIELACDYPRESWGDWAAVSPATMNKPMDVARMMREADALAKPWDGIAPMTRMGHVHLHVRDVDEALRFYEDVLGFDVMARLGSAAAFISAGGYHHHLGLNTWAGPRAPQPGAVGLRHFTIVYPDDAELTRMLSRVRDAGVTIEQANAGTFATDPTGNRVLLKVA